MELIEIGAATVHQRWVEHQRSLGYTSRLSPTGEELMASYEELSEAARELDRVTVRAVLAALGDIGAAITFGSTESDGGAGNHGRTSPSRRESLLRVTVPR